MSRHEEDQSITHNLFDIIMRFFPSDRFPRILELGGGISTGWWLTLDYKVDTVEHDKKWMDIFAGATYHYAPIQNQYFDRDIVIDLIKQQFDIWVLDGPCGLENDRVQFTLLLKDVLDKAMLPKIIVVDDTDLADGILTMQNLMVVLDTRCNIFNVQKNAAGIPHNATVIILE